MGLVDLHLHLLPGIDDGTKTMDEAVEMAKALVSLGYTHAAPSPHHRSEFASRNAALCEQRMAETKAALSAAGIHLQLFPNAENFFLDESLMGTLGTPQARTLGSGQVLLVEAPYQGPLPMVGDLVFRMRLKGVTPLIAHPERCLEFEKPGRAAEMVQLGALLQLDMGSLIGRYGKQAEKLARRFLADGLYAVAASDLHSPSKATQWVGDSLKALEKAVGSKAYRQLVELRPAALLAGETETA